MTDTNQHEIVLGIEEEGGEHRGLESCCKLATRLMNEEEEDVVWSYRPQACLDNFYQITDLTPRSFSSSHRL